MATVRTLIGYIKGPKGDTGATGATGAQGPAGNDGAPGVTDYATTSAAGLVRVGDDFNINSNNGTLSIKNAFTEASTLANIASGESQATILGKVKKFMTTLMPSNFLINTTNSTATDKALTANMGKTLAGDLATVQTSATASKAYAEGDYLVLNGQLYLVTAAIANGGTITVGTNVTAASVGRQLVNIKDSLSTTNGHIFSGVLPNGTNLDTVGAVGTYLLSGSYTYTNAPATWGILEVFRHTNTNATTGNYSFAQRVTQTSNVFYRFHSEAGWGSWKALALQDSLSQSYTSQVMSQKGLGVSFVRFGHYKRIRLNGTLTETLASETLLDFGDISTLAGAEYAPEFTYLGTHMLRTNARANVIMYTSNSGNYVKNHLYMRVYGSEWANGNTFLLDVSYN